MGADGSIPQNEWIKIKNELCYISKIQRTLQAKWKQALLGATPLSCWPTGGLVRGDKWCRSEPCSFGGKHVWRVVIFCTFHGSMWTSRWANITAYISNPNMPGPFCTWKCHHSFTCTDCRERRPPLGRSTEVANPTLIKDSLFVAT